MLGLLSATPTRTGVLPFFPLRLLPWLTASLPHCSFPWQELNTTNRYDHLLLPCPPTPCSGLTHLPLLTPCTAVFCTTDIQSRLPTYQIALCLAATTFSLIRLPLPCPFWPLQARSLARQMALLSTDGPLQCTSHLTSTPHALSTTRPLQVSPHQRAPSSYAFRATYFRPGATSPALAAPPACPLQLCFSCDLLSTQVQHPPP